MLLPSQVRKKLAALARGKMPPAEPAALQQPVVADRPAVLWIPPLEQVPTGQVITTAHGPLLSCRLAMTQVGDWAPQVAQQSLDKLRAAWEELVCQPHRFCLLDIETAGLSSEALFLVGLLHLGSTGIHIHQFLARDYSEEPALLAESVRLLEEADVWFSYNGRAFDLPYIQDRLRYHRLPAVKCRRHVDILIQARRQFSGKLQDCKLLSLERELFGRARLADIPGAQIPEAYRRFVSSGDTDQLAIVMQHNQLDLMALWQATAELAPHAKQEA